MAGAPESRTTMDYTTGAFYWEAGDYIYVQDDDNVWQKSSNAPTGKTASFKFYVPGKFEAKTSYRVYYPGKNGTKNEVTIPAAQTQTEPNSTAHFGVSGDCGTAMATKVAGISGFSFKLDHQAAYLVFQPYLGNDNKLVSTYVTKIEVTSDKKIIGSYTLNSSTAELIGTGAANQITLTTKGTSGPFVNGFPLTKAIPDLAANGAYIIIKPGTYKLKVRYWIKDIVTQVEGIITKNLSSFPYVKNTYYDMTANLDIKNYDGNHYYMWDAKEQYWKGHEWWSANKDQPVLAWDTNSNYAQNNSDSRWYNETYPGLGVSNPATHASCKDLPNVNEMVWYAQKGDPHWDEETLWTTMGHLYKGGMWFKKKVYISDFDVNKAPDGVDWRIVQKHDQWSSSNTLPPAADAHEYFYLPALGHYYGGQLLFVGSYVHYWSSSACPNNFYDSYNFTFGNNNSVRVWDGNRDFGYCVGVFE